MKKIVTTIILSLCITTFLSAQNDTLWRRGGGLILNFNQTSLTNWAAGGESNLATTLLTNVYDNYKKNKTTWDNSLIVNYGLITANNYNDIRKNDDKIELNSKYGQYAFDKFYYAGLVTFTSQLFSGYDYLVDPASTNPISKFLSPGYVTAAAGLDWKPNAAFSLFISPATGKFTFVTDDAIDNELIDSANNKNRYGNVIGEKLRSEFGASIVASLNTKIGENSSLSSKLTLFDNYTDVDKGNRKNIDVDWQNTLSFKLSKFFTAGIFTELIYDHNIAIPIYNADDVQTGVGPRTQFKEVFGLAFSYSFNGYSIK